MVDQEFIGNAAGAVNASMNPLKVVTQKHPRLATSRDALVVDRDLRKAPPVAQDHRVVVTHHHHPDGVIALATVVKLI